MPDTIFHEMMRDDGGGARGRWVRLRTLTTLRWLAVMGQAAAVFAADQVFGLAVPRELCALAIAASVVFNVIAMQVFPPTTRLNERAAMFSMLFDLGQVSVLLMLTGGLANPFAMLLLAPVTISASALTLRSSIVVGVTALALISAMAQLRLPLAYADGEIVTAPPIYIFGVWAALTLSVFFMTFYARRVSLETYRMSRALRAAEAALGREQRLTAIGGLAAAAAHELGTPLATIKLVSGELADELADHAELREDAELIHFQAERCGAILAELAQGGRADEQIKRTPIAALVEEAAEPHSNRGRQIIARIDGAPAAEAGPDQPLVARRPEIIHGLRNLIQNAVDFSDTTVWVDISETRSALRIAVGDDGPGFADDLLQHLGDPYVTSRPRGAGGQPATTGERSGSPDSASAGYTGMGLGLFIAKTLLERTGARVSFANGDRTIRRNNRGLPMEKRRPSGAVVAVVWPLDAIVTSKEVARGPLRENERFGLDNV